MIINLLIACRIHLFAVAMKQLLEKEVELNVCGTFSGEDDLDAIAQMPADILLADHDICLGLLSRLSWSEAPKILFINDASYFSTTGGDLREMVSRGLAGILPNGSDLKMLMKAIRSVHAGDLWLDHRTIKTSLCSRDNNKKFVHLTQKETQVCDLLCAGHSNKEIAQSLFISVQTVKSHCNRLYKKFGVSNRVKLTLCIGRKRPENPLLSPFP